MPASTAGHDHNHAHVDPLLPRRTAMSNDAPTPISDDEVVALAKAAFTHSRSDLSHRTAESAPRELQQQHPGITIDLGHKNIARLPDEVINVIRAEIERCACPCRDPLRWGALKRARDMPY